MRETAAPSTGGVAGLLMTQSIGVERRQLRVMNHVLDQLTDLTSYARGTLMNTISEIRSSPVVQSRVVVENANR
jgi:hypothetical protein